MSETKRIKYQKGFKYQLTETSQYQVSIKPKNHIATEFIDLDQHGVLTIRSGYAWDGPSGPTIDTKNFMRGSLVHDALYQLIRHEHLSIDDRLKADDELKRCCLEDGMTKMRAWWVYKAVTNFGFNSSLPKSKRVTLIAPH